MEMRHTRMTVAPRIPPSQCQRQAMCWLCVSTAAAVVSCPVVLKHHVAK